MIVNMAPEAEELYINMKAKFECLNSAGNGDNYIRRNIAICIFH
jgi:hypothetical protein